MHELGHVIGVDDVSPALRPDDVMDETLSPGERRLPTAVDATGAVTAAPAALAVAATDPAAADGAGAAGLPPVVVTSNAGVVRCFRVVAGRRDGRGRTARR